MRLRLLAIEQELSLRKARHRGEPAGAPADGDPVAQRWIAAGELVAGRAIAHHWRCTTQALMHAVKKGRLCSALVNGRRYYPTAFLGLPQAGVLAVCTELHALPLDQQMSFWQQRHEALGRATVAEALRAAHDGPAWARVMALAQQKAASLAVDDPG